MLKTTIIIPTYNRPNYLRRILNYYDSFQEKKSYFDIIVADSSSNENKKRNQKIINSLNNFKILYLNDYPEEINPWYKFTDAVKHVKSEYCLFCADDDFIVPNSIYQAVNFLNENQDFTVAHGRYILFHFKNQEKIFWKWAYSHESIIFPDSKSRLIYHLSNYSIPTMYGVHRADFLKMILEENTKFTDDPRFGEILPSMLDLIYGKMMCLDVLYAAREGNPELTSTSSTVENMYDFIRKGSYAEKYYKFKKCLVFHLIKNSELNLEESEKVVDESMSVYLRKSYPMGFKRFLKNKLKKFLGFFSNTTYENIMTTYSNARLIFDFKKKRGNCFDAIDNPVSIYYDDFKKIRDSYYF